MSNTAPLNFPDVVFGKDIDPMGSEITSDLQGLQQDVRHILEQVLGTNLDDTTKGIGIEERLSGTVADLLACAGEIDQQLPEDDRIDSSTTTIAQLSDGSFSIDVEVHVGSQVVNIGFTYSAEGGLQAQ